MSQSLSEPDKTGLKTVSGPAAITPLTPQERNRVLVEWNLTAEDYPSRCIQQLFEDQVSRTPSVMALTSSYGGKNNQVTYAELNKRSNQLAHYLRTLGVGPEIRVGICLERSIDMIVGILGVLKAGGAYLPLEPSYPPERLAFLVKDARTPVILTQQDVVNRIPVRQSWVVSLDSDWKIIAQESEQNPLPLANISNLAYVMYTSGSTGRPKGVLVEHASLTSRLTSLAKRIDVQPGWRLLPLVPFSFDVSIADILLPLLVGGTLFLDSPEILSPGPQIVELLREKQINTVQLPASLLASLPFEELPDLKTIIVGGEPCSIQVVARWAAGRRFFNAYGPTEATIYATIAECKDDKHKPLIGRPLANTDIYLLDEKLEPVAFGAPGELYIGGVGVARGYLNQPGLTAETFIPHPFSKIPGARLYRTGDLARYHAEGEIEFLDRIDYQIKMGGLRIEPSEIEAVLYQHHAVRDSIVVAAEDERGQKRLIAYLVSDLDVDRVPLQAPCLAEFENGDVMTLTTEDISSSGVCLVGVADPCTEGEHVRLRLELPGTTKELSLQGTVEWYHGERVGVQFKASSTEQAILRQSIDFTTRKQDFSVFDLRRSEFRVPLHSRCLVETDEGRVLELNTEDLSYHGVQLVGVPPSFERGGRLRLRVLLPGISHGLWLEGIIAWRQNEYAGVHFRLSPTDQLLLHQSVESILETRGFSITHLHNYLKEKLPEYMIPSAFVILEALPLTPNGKVDRSALPPPRRHHPEDKDTDPRLLRL